MCQEQLKSAHIGEEKKNLKYNVILLTALLWKLLSPAQLLLLPSDLPLSIPSLPPSSSYFYLYCSQHRFIIFITKDPEQAEEGREEVMEMGQMERGQIQET